MTNPDLSTPPYVKFRRRCAQAPSPPNFVRVWHLGRLSGHCETQVDIADLTEAELREIAKAWTERLIEKARNRRESAARGRL